MARVTEFIVRCLAKQELKRPKERSKLLPGNPITFHRDGSYTIDGVANDRPEFNFTITSDEKEETEAW